MAEIHEHELQVAQALLDADRAKRSLPAIPVVELDRSSFVRYIDLAEATIRVETDG